MGLTMDEMLEWESNRDHAAERRKTEAFRAAHGISAEEIMDSGMLRSAGKIITIDGKRWRLPFELSDQCYKFYRPFRGHSFQGKIERLIESGEYRNVFVEVT